MSVDSHWPIEKNTAEKYESSSIGVGEGEGSVDSCGSGVDEVSVTVDSERKGASDTVGCESGFEASDVSALGENIDTTMPKTRVRAYNFSMKPKNFFINFLHCMVSSLIDRRKICVGEMVLCFNVLKLGARPGLIPASTYPHSYAGSIVVWG